MGREGPEVEVMPEAELMMLLDSEWEAGMFPGAVQAPGLEKGQWSLGSSWSLSQTHSWELATLRSQDGDWKISPHAWGLPKRS